MAPLKLPAWLLLASLAASAGKEMPAVRPRCASDAEPQTPHPKIFGPYGLAAA